MDPTVLAAKYIGAGIACIGMGVGLRHRGVSEALTVLTTPPRQPRPAASGAS